MKKVPDCVDRVVMGDVCVATAEVLAEHHAEYAAMPAWMAQYHYALVVQAAIVAYAERTRAPVPAPSDN